MEWVIPIINMVVKGDLPEKVLYVRGEDFRQKDNQGKVLQKGREPICESR